MFLYLFISFFIFSSPSSLLNALINFKFKQRSMIRLVLRSTVIIYFFKHLLEDLQFVWWYRASRGTDKTQQMRQITEIISFSLVVALHSA